MTEKIEWLCFSTDPNVDRYANGMAGRRLHAFMNSNRSVCGRRPAHGTAFDLFNEKKCVACLRNLGLACPKCKGRGVTGSAKKNTLEWCSDCKGTGEMEK